MRVYRGGEIPVGACCQICGERRPGWGTPGLEDSRGVPRIPERPSSVLMPSLPKLDPSID